MTPEEIHVADAFAEDDFADSRLEDVVTGVPSSSAALFAHPSDGETRVGVWRAQPGVYRHPGGDAETFVVLEGQATLVVPDRDAIELSAGTVVRIPARTPSEMRVSAHLRKLSLVTTVHTQSPAPAERN